VVWGYASSHKTKGVGISVIDVHTNIRHILDNLLCAIETSWAASNNCKAVLLVRLDLMLTFDLLLEFRIVVLSIIEPKGAKRCVQWLQPGK